MIGPPYIMRGEAGQAEFAKVDPAFQTPAIPVLYVTDRACDKKNECGPVYGFNRSRVVEYGVATVGLTPEPTWDQLVIDSTSDMKHEPYALRMKSVEPPGQFLDLNLRMQVQNGEIGLDAAAIEAVKNERVEFNAAVSRWLDQSQSKDAYVYVHGFNNTFDDAVFRIAESWHYAGRQGVPIVFTWPAGRGGLTGYAYDRESGEFAVVHLKLLLLALADNPGIENVHIISHSRGTDVATSALRELHQEVRAATGRGAVGLLGNRPLVHLTPEQFADAPTTGEYLKIKTLVLAAPDLDADVFSQRFVTENLLRAADRVVIYFSQQDSALAAAQWLFSGGKGRLGSLEIEDFTPQQIALVSQLTSVEMISCETKGYSSHSYMFMHPSAFSDLLLVLREGNPPGAENGRPLEQPRPGLWLMTDDYLKPPKSP
jgi:esterase/lipase superfamily enzyme